jgi:serine/threonine protein kinase
MKQVCLLCERTSIDGNLYCQERHCQAEQAPRVLGYGERLGHIEIVKPVTVLRTGVVYEAAQDGRKLFIKVANIGAQHTDRLKREAAFVHDIARKRKPHRNLPIWLPPYAHTTVAPARAARGKQAKQTAVPYGRALMGSQLVYYYLFKYVDGESLRDILTKQPQLWIDHIGWIVIQAAEALTVLNQRGFLHCGLSPETILVNFDTKSNVPALLLCDLGMVSRRQEVAQHWDAFRGIAPVPPAYTAPELLKHPRGPINYPTDVYGLGLLLYEMLTGEPRFPFRLKNDTLVQRRVEAARPGGDMARIDDVLNSRIVEITMNAINPEPAERFRLPAERAAAKPGRVKDREAPRERGQLTIESINPYVFSRELRDYFLVVRPVSPLRKTFSATLAIILGLLLAAFVIVLLHNLNQLRGF